MGRRDGDDAGIEGGREAGRGETCPAVSLMAGLGGIWRRRGLPGDGSWDVRLGAEGPRGRGGNWRSSRGVACLSDDRV